MLALIYRSFRLAGEEEVPDDAEDTRVSRLPTTRPHPSSKTGLPTTVWATAVWAIAV